ncbi:unnamed protein product [Urochloa decumbens]|uniref:GRF-type domain-containing protein n=1 Tax=Urochloa decumbens TaxID=240449 RepID=A0ABC8W2D8_9POAL
MAPTSTSSSASQSHRKRPELPLITCSKCGRHTIIELEVKKNDKGNRGRIFYKCPAHPNGCSFWFWEEEYVEELNAIAREKAKDEAMLVEEEKHIRPKNDELVDDIRALVCIGKEIVSLLKCFLFVFVCALSLAGYACVRR